MLNYVGTVPELTAEDMGGVVADVQIKPGSREPLGGLLVFLDLAAPDADDDRDEEEDEDRRAARPKRAAGRQGVGTGRVPREGGTAR